MRDSEFGMVQLRAFGRYAMRVAEPQLFVNAIVGTQGLYTTRDIEQYLRGIIVSRFTDLIASIASSILTVARQFDEINAAMRAKLRDDFAALGLDLRGFFLESITPTEETQKAMDERAAMGAIGDMQAYLQFKAARALGDAALGGGGEGEGSDLGAGLAGAGFGLGAGAGLGAVVGAIVPGRNATGATNPDYATRASNHRTGLYLPGTLGAAAARHPAR